jgi:hypothetical protein
MNLYIYILLELTAVLFLQYEKVVDQRYEFYDLSRLSIVPKYIKVWLKFFIPGSLILVHF